MTPLLPQETQESVAEIQKLPLPPVEAEIWNLTVQGDTTSGSPYIIKDDEAFSLSLNAKFGGGTLVDFLMCIGVEVHVEFAIEGFGTATEINLSAPIVKTQKGVYEYQPTLNIPGGPKAVGLVPGVYKAAAILIVKPATPCSQIGPLMLGYITDAVFQVYAH